MSGFVPKFRLYDSAGTTLLYTFFAVDFTNAPQSVRDTVEIGNLRSKGAVIIDGGESTWDLFMRFALIGDDYEAVTAEIVNLENTIEVNVPYILRIDKTAGSFFEYKVKRIIPFDYPENLRLSNQRVFATFKVNSW